ncbi:unnamed protein product [Cylindrotheca closterium]|uniref:DUF6824 domain-containing protein n=1 Tax=Cylindrotheca closterium TaxID=2856 RepID=A0AAD2FD24_9STRA|nr:unnamed protein product [Cylindrotheca closterium]
MGVSTMSSFNVDYGSSAGGCFGWTPFGSQFNAAVPVALPKQHQKDALMVKNELDADIAKSMHELSFQERQNVQEEIHGVSSTEPEMPERIAVCLNELDAHLGSMKAGTSWELAEGMNPAYVKNKDLRMMFLRAQKYDSKEAAAQIIRFFDVKADLFGNDMLAKDITIDDLSDDDKACLQNGSMQIPSNDRAGRPILLYLPGLRAFNSLKSELRARFYSFMSVVKSENAQRLGVIFITYAVGTLRDSMNGAGFKETATLAMAVPLHWAGIHFCSDDLTQYILTKTTVAITPAKIRARFKNHLGSHLECQYLLSSFGIPQSTLPFDSFGNQVKLDKHLLWYQRCHWEETVMIRTQLSSEDSLLEPLANDVLFGRKRNNHEGNKVLRLLVESRSKDYDTANKSRKREMAAQVATDLQEAGGRFLKEIEETGTWETVPIDEALEKIAQAFRNCRRPKMKQMKADSTKIANDTGPLEIIDDPAPEDVLFGKQRNHGGNVKMRVLVKNLADEYDMATKLEKKELASSIIRSIKEQGGRFLKQREDDRWEETTESYARIKISKQFCNNRRYQRKEGVL